MYYLYLFVPIGTCRYMFFFAKYFLKALVLAVKRAGLDLFLQ